MLHVKFRHYRTSGSGDEFFKKFFFTIYGRGGNLGQVTLTFLQTSVSLPGILYMKMWLWLTMWFQRRRSLKLVIDEGDDETIITK